METKIKTYKERPQCEVPECPNKGWILVANRWICGECCKKWHDTQREKEKQQNEEMFKDVVEAVKNDN